ncbi:MAG: rhomboid family intramembrane serine protease [Bacillota bacterium]|nr:rhomboid family intramembrane serine protease [Bacillota bacterium]
MFIRTENFREFIRFYPAISFIIFIHLLLYLFSVIPIFPNSWFIGNFSGVNLYIAEGQYWRLITPIFLHNGFTHLLFNSFALIIVGPGLEKRLGKVKFLSLYVLCGVSGNLATFILEPLSYTHTGSSGAILGLFGFYTAIIMFRKHWISRDHSHMIIALLVITLATSFLQPEINLTAHLFGLLIGFLIGTLSYYNQKEFRLSIGRAGNWASSQGPAIKNTSPMKILLWSTIIILTILGFFSQK